MKSKKSDLKDGQGKLLDAWLPPEGAGDAVGCLATSFTFSSAFFEEECLARFVGLESHASEDGVGYLIEREEKFSQLVCASELVDQRHARGIRSLRWDLVSIRIPKGILHAKVSLLLWTQAARIIVASANLTEDGYRRNHEIFSVLDFGVQCGASMEVVGDIVRFLGGVLDQAGQQGTETDQTSSPVGRARGFLDLFEQRATDLAHDASSKARIHAILTGPGRPTFLRGDEGRMAVTGSPIGRLDYQPIFRPAGGGEPARAHGLESAPPAGGGIRDVWVERIARRGSDQDPTCRSRLASKWNARIPAGFFALRATRPRPLPQPPRQGLLVPRG